MTPVKLGDAVTWPELPVRTLFFWTRANAFYLKLDHRLAARVNSDDDWYDLRVAPIVNFDEAESAADLRATVMRPCPRCAADPAPFGPGSSSRKCAFPSGAFSTDNWNCATMNVLYGSVEDGDEKWNEDQQLRVAAVHDGERDLHGAFLVLSVYKHRGRVKSAWIVAESEMMTLTLELAERVIAGAASGR